MCLSSGLAQNTIRGKVVDESGLPLPSANISIKGTSTGTLTDFDGLFSIEVNI
ncbi:MAG: carboxypeptidase-like regulatory domain-containing protein, partial [Psychroflexus sp.]|nr:carboxypeptidase-like regulatory domain-containing protein [Psychroflexus sp.]